MDGNHSTCCDVLAYYLERECPMHPGGWDCPDRLFYRATDGEIGIVIRNDDPDGNPDPNPSFVTMRFCPFCASELPLNPLMDDDGTSSGADPFRRIDLG